MLARSITLALVALSLFACGDGEGGALVADAMDDARQDANDIDAVVDAPLIQEAESGSRIKAVNVTTADGAKSFSHWYDSQLETKCQFLTAADGKNRCLPSGAAWTLRMGVTDPVPIPYYNHDCSRRLAGVSVGTGEPCTFAWETAEADPMTCGSTMIRIFPIEALYEGAIYLDGHTGVGCNEPGIGTGPYTAMFTIGAEMPPEMFVEGILAEQ